MPYNVSVEANRIPGRFAFQMLPFHKVLCEQSALHVWTNVPLFASTTAAAHGGHFAMSRKKKPAGQKLSSAVLALYGDVQLVKAYCERCDSNAFVINGRLACCGAELKVNPKHQYRESPIKEMSSELREQLKHHSENRKARMELNGGSHTSKEWRELCKKYGYLCLCCGERKPLTEDHIIPVVLGGTDDISNIQPLCMACNSKKSGKFIDYRPKFS